MQPDRYVPKKIDEVMDKDRKVSITGKIIEAGESSFVVDDETGKIEVFYNPESTGSGLVDEGRTVRAFCELVGKNLNLDILQDLSSVDLNLLKTVDELYSKASVS